MFIKDSKAHTYFNYYNFTFEQAIDKKKQNSRFNEAELTYIMSCLLKVVLYLKGHGVVVGDYRSSRFFMSPEGYIKIYS